MDLSSFFNETFLAAIAATVTATKFIRNALGNIKGTPALIITIVVSLVVGEVLYFNQGLLYGGAVGLMAGLASAGVFRGTKLLGNVVKVDLGNK